MFTFYSNIMKSFVRSSLEDLNQLLIRPENRNFLEKKLDLNSHIPTRLTIKLRLVQDYACLQLYQLLFLFLVQIIEKCGKGKTGAGHK